ncbi:MAG: tetratricopeptide repeat protein [Desulfobacterales bacterium]|jgi:tetratricopeptide (TPR) repeat protein
MGYSRTDSIIKDHKHLLFKILLVILCLIIGIVVVYIKVQSFDFVGYDDELYVTKNLHVQKGISLEGFKWAFTTFHAANWHPLTWLSHMLDCELFGLDPSGHHWTNVEFHIANTLLLFIILFKMTGALWQSAFVAALFALHPLHVESVAWISERKDVLSTFLGLLTLAAYYRYVKKFSAKCYILVLALLSLSLMAKPMLVTMPFVMLLLDFWPLKRFQYQPDFYLKSEKVSNYVIKKKHWIILEKIPLFILVIISIIVTFFAQKSVGAVKTIGALPLKYRIANATVSYVSYFLKAIWPNKLSIFYLHPGNTLPSWQIVGGAMLIVFACYGAIWSAKKYPYIPVGLFWYLGTLVPVIGLVQVGDQAMADRYTYIPLIGIFIIVTWGAADLFKKLRDQTSEVRGQKSEVGSLGTEVEGQRSAVREQQPMTSSSVLVLFNKRRFQNIFLGISAGIILVALSWKTSFQLNTWKNGITLFEHAVSVTENNYPAHYYLGAAYEPINLDKAVSHYKAALKIKPGFALALNNLGIIYSKKGQIDEAVNYYLKALQTKPDYFDALNNLGIAFVNKENYDQAVLSFEKALKIDPQKTDARMNLANVLYLQSKPDEAISQYEETLQSDSENADAHYNLAYVLYSQNKINEAVFHYEETLKIDPKYLKAHYKLGNIYFNQGKTKKAFIHYSEIIKIKPDCAQAYNKLGIILFRQRKFSRAKVLFSKAIQIDPKYSEAHINLDIVQNTTLSR